MNGTVLQHGEILSIDLDYLVDVVDLDDGVGKVEAIEWTGLRSRVQATYVRYIDGSHPKRPM